MVQELASQTVGETQGYLVASYIICSAIQWAKNRHWIPLDATTESLNRAVALVLSAVATLGIHVEFNSTAGDLTIHGLLLTSVLHYAGDWLQQFVMQQIIYKAAFRRA